MVLVVCLHAHICSGSSLCPSQHAQIRGKALTGDPTHPEPVWDQDKRLVWAAFNKTAAISFFPVSMFANSYTCVLMRTVFIAIGATSCVMLLL